MSKPKGEKYIGIRYTARLFIIIFTFILAIGAAAPALSASQTQTDWSGGPTKPSLQVGTWAPAYDNFYDNENVDWSQAGKVKLENFGVPPGVAFRLAGWFESSIIDACQVADWGIISWSENKPAAGFNFTQLTNLGQDRADAVWSSDMSKIAFQSMRSGSHQIWVMNADGTNPQQLTFSHGGQPSWSPDGSRIAYWRYLDNLGISSIMTMKPDGTDQQVVINMGDHPTWSPDGTRIAFTTAFGPGSKGNIWRVNADGTGLTQLTFGSYWDWGPAWSPLGDKIAFSSNRDGTYEIWTVNVDGSGLTQLTELNNPLPWYEVSWCPDGSKLAFEYDNNSPTRIWTINADGTNPQPFVVGPTTRNIDPCWSPDGTKILFTSDDPGDIWVAEIQHIDIVVKLRTGGDNDPRDGGWSGWYQHSNGAENTLMENGRYVQYRVELSTTDNTKTPEIFDIIIIYELVGDNTPPPAPTLISPENGDNILDNTPTFKWTSVSDPSGVTYQIQVDDNSDFSSPVYSEIGLTRTTLTLPDEDALPMFIQFFWHVRAVDGMGNPGDWSDEWNFTVVPMGAIGVLLMPLLMLLPFALMLRRQNRRYHY